MAREHLVVGSLSRLSRKATKEVILIVERIGPEACFDGESFLDFLEMASFVETREDDNGVLSGLLNGRGPDTESYFDERVLACFISFFFSKPFLGLSSGISLEIGRRSGFSFLNLFLVTLSMKWSLQIRGPAQYRPEHLFSSKHLRGRRELEKGSQQKYIADSQLVSLAPLAPCMRQITATSTGLMVIITPDLISHYLASIATLL